MQDLLTLTLESLAIATALMMFADFCYGLRPLYCACATAQEDKPEEAIAIVPNNRDLKGTAPLSDPWEGEGDKAIALRKNIRTLFESSINTTTKAIKLIPALPHPILEHTPPMLDVIQVWRIRRQIPNLTSRFSHNFLNRLGAVETRIIDKDDISRLQLRYQTLC
jgi:hypothetical protein